jgi:hypothetical protein
MDEFRSVPIFDALSSMPFLWHQLNLCIYENIER